jgi:peptidoglycan/LPS O-acetylase OafA/YrhL
MLEFIFSPTSPVPAIWCVLIAMATAWLIQLVFGKHLEQHRYATIDGLRGYLAFLVFLHHSAVWFFYLKTNAWTGPPSNIYAQFGESSVALFFMITAFLFGGFKSEEQRLKV